MKKYLYCLALLSFMLHASMASGASKFCDPQQGWGPTSEMNSVEIKDFYDASAWKTGKANDLDKIALSKVSGIHGDALRIEYDLGVDTQTGPWVYFGKPCSVDLSQAGRISFWIRGEGQLVNDLQFKVDDADGGVFLRNFLNFAKTSDWHKVVFDIGELAYGWGGSNATPEPPFKWDLAVVKPYTSKNGGKGWVEIADIKRLGADPYIQLLMNQVGFDPGMNKRAVVQLCNSGAEINTPIEYSILTYPEGKVVETGSAPKFKSSAIWPGQYWVISFDKLGQPGKYTIKTALQYEGKPMKVQSYPFTVKPNVLAEELSRPLFHYINYSRYPAHPKHANPVPGGYWDTELDIERWMTTIPVWVWGMAYWQNMMSPEIPLKGFDSLDEISFGALYSIAMQDQNGGIHVAEKSVNPQLFFLDTTPETDPWDCVLWGPGTPEVDGAYTVAMTEVYKALEKKDPKLAKDSLRAAEKAWQHMRSQQLNGIQFLGMYLWASTRLYQTTKDPVILDAAKAAAEQLLPLQCLDYKNNQYGIFGVFFANADKSDFTYQYKFVHSIGIYMGMMELSDALPDNDPLKTKIRFAMDCFAYGFIKQTTELNPFGKVGQSLEPAQADGKDMKLFYFATPRTPMGNHGFNCDIMSYGLIALRYARYTGNPEFAKIAVNQLSWVLGTNPGGFCMVSGKGTTNPHLMMTDINKGPTLGAVCNGFVSPGDGNAPKWVTEWNSEEYWKVHSGVMLALLSELESDKLSDPFVNGKNATKTSIEELKAKIDSIVK